MTMDQSACKPTLSSPAERDLETSTLPDQVVPRAPAESENHSDFSSPVQPFPELDVYLDHEADMSDSSPTFAHEADTRTAPAALLLPAPVIERTQRAETGPVVRARVAWAQCEASEEEEGEMKEATGKALEWARQMFGKEFGCDSKDSSVSEHDIAEKEKR